MTLWNISKELLKYLGLAAGTQLTKSDAMKQVSARVKSDKLQDPKNMRQFKPNAALGKSLITNQLRLLHLWNSINILLTILHLFPKKLSEL